MLKVNSLKKLASEQIVNDVLEQRCKELQKLIDVQCSDGNWNYDSYMHGMANGMILSLGVIEDVDPNFLEAPKKWLNGK